MTNLDSTIAALRAALAVSPENGALWLHLAALLRDHGRLEESEAEYRAAQVQIRAALAQRPADPQLYEQLAEIQRALGDAAGAETNQGIAAALRGAPAAPALPEPVPPAPPVREAPMPLTEWLAGADAPLDPNAGIAERPTATFADVGGMEAVKERIRMAIIYPLQRPEVFAAYGRRTGGGLLLYGPPGCGKTYLARATAGEVRASFFNVGISDVLDMWHGQSEQKLHALFESARRARPAVLFFDEIEAIGGNRLDMRQHFQRTLVNQFLAELDGVTSDNDGLLIAGATNAPWHVDSALRRPGRFDQIVFVAPPDEPARREILRLHLRGKPAGEAVDLARLARETEGFSGADLRALVDGAAEQALQAALRGGQIQPLTTDLLLRALRERRASTTEWLSTARNYVLYSNEGGLYDDVAEYLRKHKLMR
jgi:SpoVK/Ycf46/Vps4 family AAA+-type ATPase